MPGWLERLPGPGQALEGAPEGPESALAVLPWRGAAGGTRGYAGRPVWSRIPEVVDAPRLQALALKPPEPPTQNGLRSLLGLQRTTSTCTGSRLGSTLGTRSGSGSGISTRSVSGVSRPIFSSCAAGSRERSLSPAQPAREPEARGQSPATASTKDWTVSRCEAAAPRPPPPLGLFKVSLRPALSLTRGGVCVAYVGSERDRHGARTAALHGDHLRQGPVDG